MVLRRNLSSPRLLVTSPTYVLFDSVGNRSGAPRQGDQFNGAHTNQRTISALKAIRPREFVGYVLLEVKAAGIILTWIHMKWPI